MIGIHPRQIHKKTKVIYKIDNINDNNFTFLLYFLIFTVNILGLRNKYK